MNINKLTISRSHSISTLTFISKLKFGSAVHSCSGGRQDLAFLRPGGVEDVQSGSCLLYAMLIVQSVPRPVELDTEEHVGNTRSMVPSRSDLTNEFAPCLEME